MKEVVREAGLRSDGELVQAVSDTLDFVAPRPVAGLLLPAVIAAREAARDDDGAPDALASGDGGATADHDHRDWCDLQSMGGGGAAAGADDAPIATVYWDLG